MNKIKFNLNEFTGAFGDIGVMIPIVISLVVINGMDLGVILLLAGSFYIFCGLYYRIPVPVQPLKAVASIAIAGGLGVPVISVAGIMIGIILIFFAVTGLVNRIAKIFSKPIIRGIQFGVGLMLVRTSWNLVTRQLGTANNIPLDFVANHLVPWLFLIVLAVVILVIIFWTKHFSAATILLGIGLILSIFNGYLNAQQVTFSDSNNFRFILPSLVKAFFLLVIPQLPLTFGNAVIATKDTAWRYFDKGAKKVTYYTLSRSIGIANIISGIFGGMPVCHGSGGLTAHYSFGARTGGSGVIIGTTFILMALLFGQKAVTFLSAIPHAFLGAMLFYVGIRHAVLIADLRDRVDILIAVMIGIVALFIYGEINEQ
jgi:SulP family sulfate permease